MAINDLDLNAEILKLRDIIHEFFEHGYREGLVDDSMGFEKWAPAVDIYEIESSIVVKMELPGVDKDNVDVEFNNGKLIITGNREMAHSTGSLQRMERMHGPFRREFNLPLAVDSKGITAGYELGVLTVALPLPPKKKVKKVPIENDI
jgi:HSP20 family protein